MTPYQHLLNPWWWFCKEASIRTRDLSLSVIEQAPPITQSQCWTDSSCSQTRLWILHVKPLKVWNPFYSVHKVQMTLACGCYAVYPLSSNRSLVHSYLLPNQQWSSGPTWKTHSHLTCRCSSPVENDAEWPSMRLILRILMYVFQIILACYSSLLFRLWLFRLMYLRVFSVLVFYVEFYNYL